MQAVIECAYTSFISVTHENVDMLLVAAAKFKMDVIQKACTGFLKAHLCPQNCIRIWRSRKHSLVLRRKAFRFILDHFEEIFNFSEEFLQMSLRHLKQILKNDKLNVRKESTVFEAILRWIAHSPEARNNHIGVLLPKVRLALLGTEYLVNYVQHNQLVINSPQCMLIVSRALVIAQDQRSYINAFSCPLARPRLPKVILLATGGWSHRAATGVIDAYDVRAELWVNVTNNVVYPRAYHGAVFLSSSIYWVGGCSGVEHFNSMSRFDLTTHTWHEAAPMHERRCYVSVTVLNGCIYAMGGHDGYSRLNSAERYNPVSNQWTVIAPMQEPRSDASCTTFNDKVYICGGFNGEQCLSTAECYNPETNQWTHIAPMTSSRSGIGVIAYAGRIYAVGGFNGTERLTTAEAYNPQTDVWLPVPSMLNARSNFGIEVLEDRLFVVGGFNGTNVTVTAECYDVRTARWSPICDIRSSRSALSCCVVSGLPNIAEYAARRGPLLDYRLDS